MAVLYAIRDWDQNFEISQSRKSDRLRWVAIPNKHDGKSYRRLMRLPRGLEIYGAWVLIVQVASKCPTRGVLADADGPLSAADISDKTGCDAEVVQLALDACSSPAIGWIVCSQRAGSAVGAEWERGGTTLQDSTLQDSTRNTPLPPKGGDEPGESATSDSGRSDAGKPRVRQPRDRSKSFDPLAVALPPGFDCPGFRAAWSEWCQYRAAKRKPLSEMAVQRLLAELIRYGPAVSEAAIAESIKNDWQGVFPEKVANGSSHRPGAVVAGPGQVYAGGEPPAW